jgi:hypothetical protein
VITRRGLFGLFAGAVATVVAPKPKWEWRGWYARVPAAPTGRIYFSSQTLPREVRFKPGGPIDIGDAVSVAPDGTVVRARNFFDLPIIGFALHKADKGQVVDVLVNNG